MSQPSIFLGSSVEQLDMAREIAGKLGYSAVVHIWDDIFPPGQTTLNSLIDKANEVDFAAFIFAPDDQVISRSKESQGPRDNVVFEAGLFGGILGMERSMIIHARGAKLPSDLQGLTPISYDPQHSLTQRASHAAHELKKVMEERGWKGSDSLSGQLTGDWWQFGLGGADKERSRLSFLAIQRDGQLVSLSGQAMTSEGENFALFESLATRLNEGDRSLFYYWEGRWPGQKSAAMFGEGKITLQASDRGAGYFTVNSATDLSMRERIEAAYLRATEQESEIMRAVGDRRRKSVIKRQLERLGEMAFV